MVRSLIEEITFSKRDEEAQGRGEELGFFPSFALLTKSAHMRVVCCIFGLVYKETRGMFSC